MSIIHITKYKELSFRNIWALIQGVKDLWKYFPDYSDKQIPDKNFMFFLSCKRWDIALSYRYHKKKALEGNEKFA